MLLQREEHLLMRVMDDPAFFLSDLLSSVLTIFSLPWTQSQIEVPCLRLMGVGQRPEALTHTILYHRTAGNIAGALQVMLSAC
jgi:hypothetical protein